LRDAEADAAAVVRERDHDLLGRYDGRRDGVGCDAGVPEERAHRQRVSSQQARRGRRRRRLRTDVERPLDEVGADRHARRSGDAERVVGVANVVDRPGEDVRRQHDGDRDREEPEEELGDGQRTTRTLHVQTLAAAGRSTVQRG
jgi:hypothetical protein